MSYREWAAPASLAGLVECAWSAGLPVGAAGHEHAILPDGCMDLLWSGTELLVAGPDTRPHRTLRRPGESVCGLRFAPGRLPALLGVPAAELRDTRVPLEELHPRPAGRVSARLAARADGPAAVLAALTDLTTALPGGLPEPHVPVLAARLATGAESVAELADRLGLTPRTLHRHCLAAFGYGPSVLRRVLRFRRATEMLHAGMAPAWVAAATGYADQPHLSRELRALGGTSPARLAAAAA